MQVRRIMGFGFSASEAMRFSAEDGILEMQSHIASPSSEGLLGGVFALERRLGLGERNLLDRAGLQRLTPPLSR